ncbi:MAG: hypothetical protein NW203_08995 [Hyphomonadaceae bacterium]|nr:hypothetical protein [Hyphomonadaceae bacterium]
MKDAAVETFARSLLAQEETLLWRQAAPPAAQADMLLLALMGTAVLGAIVWRGARAWRDSADLWKASLYTLAGAAAAAASLYCWGQTLGVGSTIYAITDTRVIIASRDPWIQAQSFGPEDFERMHRSGDRIAFNWGPKRGPDGYRAHLFGLRDAAHVEHLIAAHIVRRSQASHLDGCIIRGRMGPPGDA